MRLLAIPGNIAEKIAGKIDKFSCLDPVYVGIFGGKEWFVLPLTDELKALPKRFKDRIKLKIQDGTIKIFDTEDSIDPITKKWLTLKNETPEEGEQRINTRVTKWVIDKDIEI